MDVTRTAVALAGWSGGKPWSHPEDTGCATSSINSWLKNETLVGVRRMSPRKPQDQLLVVCLMLLPSVCEIVPPVGSTIVMFTLFSSPWEGPFKTCIASVIAFAVSGALYVPPPSSFAVNDPLPVPVVTILHLNPPA